MAETLQTTGAKGKQREETQESEITQTRMRTRSLIRSGDVIKPLLTSQRSVNAPSTSRNVKPKLKTSRKSKETETSTSKGKGVSPKTNDKVVSPMTKGKVASLSTKSKSDDLKVILQKVVSLKTKGKVVQGGKSKGKGPVVKEAPSQKHQEGVNVALDTLAIVATSPPVQEKGKKRKNIAYPRLQLQV